MAHTARVRNGEVKINVLIIGNLSPEHEVLVEAFFEKHKDPICLKFVRERREVPEKVFLKTDILVVEVSHKKVATEYLTAYPSREIVPFAHGGKRKSIHQGQKKIPAVGIRHIAHFIEILATKIQQARSRCEDLVSSQQPQMAIPI